MNSMEYRDYVRMLKDNCLRSGQSLNSLYNDLQLTKMQVSHLMQGKGSRDAINKVFAHARDNNYFVYIGADGNGIPTGQLAGYSKWTDIYWDYPNAFRNHYCQQR